LISNDNTRSSLINSRLPEIPPDEPDTNPVMRIHGYPQFKSIKPNNIISGCAKYCIQYETQLGEHFERLKGEYLTCMDGNEMATQYT
jgi:hypothetical protein